MRIDFEDATPMYNRIKIGTIIILVILFIGLFGVLGIYYAKLYKFNVFLKDEENYQEYVEEKNENEVVKENEGNEENEVIQPTENEIPLPKYTENSKQAMKNIYDTNTKIAYLTFDDGPSEAVTTLILDVLKEQNIKATFFVLGVNVDNYPQIVKRAYEEGHYIANHGYSHNYKKIYASAQSVLEEYNKTEKAIQEAIGVSEYSSHLFRFPGGYFGSSYKKIKRQAGNLLNKNDISFIDWNVLTGDAEGANTKEKIFENVKQYSQDKANIVLLMHDSSSKILTYETLTEVINYLKGEGYIFDNFYNIMK